MLAYDKKQIGRIHRILIPAVIFTAAVLLGWIPSWQTLVSQNPWQRERP